MLSGTDTALDLLILKLILHAASLWLLLLRILAPVDAWLEDDVLAHRGGVQRWACLVLCRQSELCPCLALCDAGADDLLVHSRANAAGGLHFLSIVVEAVCDNRLGSVLVGGDLLWWEFVAGIVKLLIVGPVLAAVKSQFQLTFQVKQVLTLLLSTFWQLWGI